MQRGWNALTHPGQSLENALVQWGAHSPTGYNVIRGLASMTASMNDPERNPVTAAFGQALRDGIAGFSYGVRSTIDLARRTGSSLLKGDWEGVRRYGGALLEGTVKGWIWGSIQTVGHLAWGAIKTVTPIGLFETVPAWTNALQEARAGKRGGWDVALTSLFLMANLIGIAGAVNGVQTQATRTALIREYGEPVRPLLAERQVIPILKNGELAPKPWTEYVLPKYQENVLPAFENQSAVAVKLNDMVTIYRYWGGNSLETGAWVTVYRGLSPAQARAMLALPNNNPATNITAFGIPKDVVIIVGKASSKITKNWAGCSWRGNTNLCARSVRTAKISIGGKSMDEQLKETQKQLRQEALSLRERVIEYYRATGDPDPFSGLPKFLEHIADVLAQDPVDARWLLDHIWGIYRVVSDDIYMEKSVLGKDLYSFKDKVREFANSVIGRSS